MRSFKSLSLVAAALMASTAMVQAADLLPPPVEDYPPEVTPHYSAGGWYIRGDIGYASLDSEGVSYTQGALLLGEFEQHELDSTWMIQGGIGYQMTDYFRVDATLAYYGSSDFDGDSAPAGSPCNGFGAGFTCDYDDNAELDSLTLLMANAYVDLGTFNGFTPYVGAGIGGAHVSWGTLHNDQSCTPSDPTCDGFDFDHGGEKEWRFAWAVHAGASYDISCKLKADVGYSYTSIEGGNMFGSGYNVNGTSPVGGEGGYGFDDGIDIHTGHVGLRYALGGGDCHQPSAPPPIVYK
ncbi:MAG: outer membrane protein [Pseudomonadota bacterium]